MLDIGGSVQNLKNNFFGRKKGANRCVEFVMNRAKTGEEVVLNFVQSRILEVVVRSGVLASCT